MKYMSLANVHFATSTLFTRKLGEGTPRVELGIPATIYNEMLRLGTDLVWVIGEHRLNPFTTDSMVGRTHPLAKHIMEGAIDIEMMAWICAYINRGTTIEGGWLHFESRMLTIRGNSSTRGYNAILFEYYYRAISTIIQGGVPNSLIGPVYRFLEIAGRTCDLSDPTVIADTYHALCTAAGCIAPNLQTQSFLANLPSYKSDPLYIGELKRLTRGTV